MFFLTIHSILIAPDIVAQISCLFTLYPGESQQYNYNDGLFDFFLFFFLGGDMKHSLACLISCHVLSAKSID